MYLRIFELFNDSSNGLSLADCSAWALAEEKDATLLTGDNKLRKEAKKGDIDVHGILYVFDLLVKNMIINKNTAVEKLNLLMEQNPRLPMRECNKRLRLWTGESD
jgi:predicted nucleic acid-binding protein